MYEPRKAQNADGAPVLAVLAGTELDSSVQSLATMLADTVGVPLCLVHPLVVPATLPLVAYSRLLAAQGDDSVLQSALDRDTSRCAGACSLICRQVGPALVAEIAELGCASVVLGAAQGSWLARWRGQAVIRYLMRHAPCRTYIVQEPVDAALPEQRVAVHS